MGNMDWIDEHEARVKEESSKDLFKIEEGDNRFVMLTHCAPLAQKWTGSKYEPAVDGDKNISIKGVCYVLQEGIIKRAFLPYTIVKAVRALQQNGDWDFTEFPFPHVMTITAKGAGTKEVEYTFTCSPKKVEIPNEVVEELKNKPTPEEIVEKIKGKKEATPLKKIEYPKDSINPEDIPF